MKLKVTFAIHFANDKFNRHLIRSVEVSAITDAHLFSSQFNFTFNKFTFIVGEEGTDELEII